MIQKSISFGIFITLPFLGAATQLREVPKPTLRFKRLSVEDGLSQVNVFQILQDQSGFIWMATQDGLNRYDGYEIRVFRKEKNNLASLSANGIQYMVEDRLGHLWVLTTAGLDRIKLASGAVARVRKSKTEGGWGPYRNAPFMYLDRQGFLWVYRGGKGHGLDRIDTTSLESKRIGLKLENSSLKEEIGFGQMVQDGDGVIWAGTDLGLFRFDPITESFHWHKNINHDRNGIVSLILGRSGKLWAGMDNGDLCVFDPSNENYQCFTPPGLSSENQSLWAKVKMQDQQGRLWLTLHERGGVVLFDPVSQSFKRVFKGSTDGIELADEDVSRIWESRSGSFWLGVRGLGLVRIGNDHRQMEVFTHDRNNTQSIGNDWVFDILQDASGVMWFGTGHGVSMLEEQQTRFVNFGVRRLATDNVAEANTRSILEDKQGILWIGTLRGLKRLDRESGTFSRFLPEPLHRTKPRSAVGAIVETRGERLIIGTWQGKVFELDRSTKQFHTLLPEGLKSPIYRIIEDQQGQLWIGTLGLGLFRLNLGTGKRHQYLNSAKDPTSLPFDEVLTLLEVASGDIWVGTRGGGLARWERQKDGFKTFRYQSQNPKSITSDDIRSLFVDSRDILWVGTHGGGLNRFYPETNTFTSFSMEDGLPNNTIYGILEDDEGFIWLSTNKGLAKFHPQTEVVRSYGLDDSLQYEEFNTGSCFRTRQGELIFGGIFGFNIFSPKEITDNAYIPPMAFTKFRVFDQDLTLDQNSTVLNYQQNFVTFEFAALSFLQNAKNRYAYRMDGVDQDWVYSGSRRYASYANLDPGNYLFRVKGSNNDGVWNETGASLQLIITPPFWRTAWFMGITILLICLLVVALFNWRTHRIRSRNRLLKSMVKQRTSDLEEAKEHAERANQMKTSFLAKLTHELRTPLNAILGFIGIIKSENLDTKDQQDYLELIDQSGQALLGLLGDVLDFHKIEEYKLVLENADFDLNQALSSALKPQMLRAKNKNLVLRLDMAQGMPSKVRGDQTRLIQVLLNLVSNALNFTREGGVLVAFRLLEHKNNTFYMQGSVTDSGIGVPTEKQTVIFESFAQADDSITRQYGGSGLGLTIVRDLVQIMGGKVNLQSPVATRPFPSNDPGSKFSFTFNLTAQMETAGEQPSSKPQHLPSNLHILVAEDNRTNQLLVSKILQQFKCVTTIVENGEQAVAAIDGAHFHAVLMDMHMPVMDGYQATRRIKSANPKLPVIALSASVYKEAIDQCFAAGVDDYLGKPFKKAELHRILGNWCGWANPPE